MFKQLTRRGIFGSLAFALLTVVQTFSTGVSGVIQGCGPGLKLKQLDQLLTSLALTPLSSSTAELPNMF